MNEEQSEKLIDVLVEIKELLKPKQEIETKIITKQLNLRPIQEQNLINFKNFVTSNEFFSTLTEKQKKQILKL